MESCKGVLSRYSIAETCSMRMIQRLRLLRKGAQGRGDGRCKLGLDTKAQGAILPHLFGRSQERVWIFSPEQWEVLKGRIFTIPGG